MERELKWTVARSSRSSENCGFTVGPETGSPRSPGLEGKWKQLPWEGTSLVPLLRVALQTARFLPPFMSFWEIEAVIFTG